jgi:hypothetical protein
MSARQIMSPMPVCEACWIKEHARWEPESVDDTGNILMRLKGVDVPQKLNTGNVEVCSKCGEITVSGIFELTDPQVVFYPAGKHLLTPIDEHYETGLEEEEEL